MRGSFDVAVLAGAEAAASKLNEKAERVPT